MIPGFLLVMSVVFVGGVVHRFSPRGRAQAAERRGEHCSVCGTPTGRHSTTVGRSLARGAGRALAREARRSTGIRP